MPGLTFGGILISGTAGGDLSGTYPNPNVDAADGIKSATTTVTTVGATAPSAGQVLRATSGTVATWQSLTNLTGWTFGTAKTSDFNAALNTWYVMDSTSTGVDGTLPAANTGDGSNGILFICTNSDNTTTIKAGGGNTVNGGDITITVGQAYLLLADGTSTWYGIRLA